MFSPGDRVTYTGPDDPGALGTVAEVISNPRSPAAVVFVDWDDDPQSGVFDDQLTHAPECTAQTRPATRYEPPEYCENEALRGEDLCEVHSGNGWL